MVKHSLACFRASVELNGTKKTVRLGSPDRLFPIEDRGDMGIPVKELMQFSKASCCSDHSKRCGCCRKGHDMWRNLPRGFNCHFGGDPNHEFWFSSTSRGHASVHVDGGKPENKISAGMKVPAEEGTTAHFRPPLEERNNPFMVNMEFQVAVDADPGPELLPPLSPLPKDSLPSPAKESPEKMIESPVAVAAAEVLKDPAPDPPTSPAVEKSHRGLDPPGSSPALRSPEPLSHTPIFFDSQAGGHSLRIKKSPVASKKLKTD